MSIMMGQQIGQKLCESLGLPKNTISFTLRVQAGRVVTVECEYAPEGDAYTVELAEYFLLPRDSDRPARAHPADAMGYDAWLQSRTERAHREYMERTSRRLACDRIADDLASYFGVVER